MLKPIVVRDNAKSKLQQLVAQIGIHGYDVRNGRVQELVSFGGCKVSTMERCNTKVVGWQLEDIPKSLLDASERSWVVLNDYKGNKGVTLEVSVDAKSKKCLDNKNAYCIYGLAR